MIEKTRKLVQFLSLVFDQFLRFCTDCIFEILEFMFVCHNSQENVPSISPVLFRHLVLLYFLQTLFSQLDLFKRLRFAVFSFHC